MADQTEQKTKFYKIPNKVIYYSTKENKYAIATYIYVLSKQYKLPLSTASSTAYSYSTAEVSQLFNIKPRETYHGISKDRLIAEALLMIGAISNEQFSKIEEENLTPAKIKKLYYTYNHDNDERGHDCGCNFTPPNKNFTMITYDEMDKLCDISNKFNSNIIDLLNMYCFIKMKQEQKRAGIKKKIENIENSGKYSDYQINQIKKSAEKDKVNYGTDGNISSGNNYTYTTSGFGIGTQQTIVGLSKIFNKSTRTINKILNALIEGEALHK